MKNIAFLLVLGGLAAVAFSDCNCSDGTGTRGGPPGVDAGADIQGVVGEPVVLICDVRLPPEDKEVCQAESISVQVLWEQMDGPPMDLEGAEQAQATFTPTQADAYKFCCTAIYPVTDLNKEPQTSQPDCVNVEVAEVVCDPPVADAGADQLLAARAGNLPATATLDGSKSGADGGPGCGLSIVGYTWTVDQQPGAQDPTIADPDQAVTTVDLPEFGDYTFQLEVQDDGGTATGRQDVDTNTVVVSLQEKAGCEGDLAVEVVSAETGAVMSGVEVVVVDAGGASHQKTTGPDGLAAFSGLAPGNRRSITARSGETVPAMPGAGQRPKFETTTVLDHCSNQITIPLQLTGSGSAAVPRASVRAKVPAAVFNTLPHSQKCTIPCSASQPCPATYYCETSVPPCVNKCTPVSLLPFFGLGSTDISGQMRVAIMVPVLPVDSFSAFPIERLFARPPTEEALLPGNLATDDTFLNGLAEALGIDPWGAECVRNVDCPTPQNPDTENYGCEDTDEGDRRCKDKNSLRNLKMDLPVGQEVPVALLLGIMNISLADLLPFLMPFLTNPDAGETVTFDVGSMLGAFKLHTIAVCLLKVRVDSNGDNDITADLKALTAEDCWSIDYTQQEVIEPIREKGAIVPANECQTDADCLWPDSGKKCRPDPQNPDKKYCFVPMFRVKIISEDAVSVYPDQTGFDPFGMKADARLCRHLPDTTQHEPKCPGESGVPTTCDGGPQYCDVTLDPREVECAYAYGVALLALDFPPGHQKLEDGGRVVVGFDFHRTPLTGPSALRFFVPDPQSTGGASVNAAQLLMRYITTMPDGSYTTVPGHLAASARSEDPPGYLELPPLLPPPDPGQLPDAGFEVQIGLIPDDPLASCQTVTFEKIYAVATAMLEPSNTQLLPAAPGETGLSQSDLKGLLLGLAVRDPAESAVYVDPLWRVYAPPDTTSFDLPAAASPFTAGQEVWLQFWGGGYTVPFDYDLFPTGMILREREISTDDTWALKKE
jgi:hypothetical protein